MYQIKAKILNIKELSIIFGSIAYVENGIFFVKNARFDINPMLYSCDITNDNIWIKDHNWENYLLKISDNRIEKLDFNIGVNGIISNVIIIFKDNILSCFSTIYQKIIVNFPKIDKINNYISNEENIFFQVDTITLKSLSLLTGNYEWELDLGGYQYLRHGREEEGKIDKIIGLWAHQLLVAMSDEELVSVDIHTGKVLWKTSNFNNTYLPDWRNRSMFRMAYWLIETGKLYQLDGNVYYSVDLETQQFDLLWHNANDENELTIVHKTYTEDYIYFTGAYHYQLSPNLVGVFNRKTLIIDWIHEVENLTGSLNQPPQVADDKLYVLDTGGTLHIFEREAPNN